MTSPVSIGMTNGVRKIASSIAPNCPCWIQLIKSFSQSATNPILSFTGNFSHQQGDGTSFSHSRWNQPACWKAALMYLSTEPLVWTFDRTRTPVPGGARWHTRWDTDSHRLHRIAPFMHFCVTRMSHRLISHDRCFKDHIYVAPIIN